MGYGGATRGSCSSNRFRQSRGYHHVGPRKPVHLFMQTNNSVHAISRISRRVEAKGKKHKGPKSMGKTGTFEGPSGSLIDGWQALGAAAAGARKKGSGVCSGREWIARLDAEGVPILQHWAIAISAGSHANTST